MARLLRIFTTFALVLFIFELSAQTKPKTQFYLPIADAVPGESLCLDLSVTDFRDIEGVGLGVRWDTTALAFSNYNLLPGTGLTESHLNVPFDDTGLLLLSWVGSSGLTLEDGSVYLQLCFEVKENSGVQFAHVSFDDRKILAEIITDYLIFENPFINARFYSGGVRISAEEDDLSLSGQTLAFRSCNDDDPAIQLTVEGGAPPYQYAWTGPDGFTSTEKDLTRIVQGNYSVRVTDQMGAQAVGNFLYNILENDSEEAALANFGLPALNGALGCGQATDSIGVQPPPDAGYSYYWPHSGENTAQIEIDSIGRYTVEARRGICVEEYVLQVVSFDSEPDLTLLSTDFNCSDTLKTIGVLPISEDSYTYRWSTGDNTATIDVDQTGNYSLFISESAYCFKQLTFRLNAVDSFQYSKIEQDLHCLNASSNIGVIPGGEIADYAYQWQSGETSPRINVTEPGSYRLELKKDAFCYTKVDFEVASPSQEELRLRAYLSCTPNEQGQIEEFIYAEILSGGTPPYYFNWNSGESDTSYYRSRLPFDGERSVYEIEVTDQLGKKAVWNFHQGDLHACGPDSSAVFFEAPHIIVAPGSQFVYPVRVHNYKNLARAIFTIDWDKCLLIGDSIVQHYPERVVFKESFIAEAGTYEVYFADFEGLDIPDTALIAEVYFSVPENMEGISPFLFSINEPGSYRDGSTAFLRPGHGSIAIASQQALVKPGDTDTNFIVNHFDVLNLGLNFNDSGPDRRLRQKQEQEYAYPWAQKTPVSEIDLKHIDCNGDGSINALDTSIIALNWDLSQALAEKSLLNENGPPVLLAVDTLFPGATQNFPIELGRENEPAQSVYGIALSLRYDPEVIIPESVYADFSDNWLAGNSDTPPLTISRNDPVNHLIHLALARTNGENISGYGSLAQLYFQTRSSPGVSGAMFSVESIRLINAGEQLIPTNAITTFAPLDRNTATHNPQLDHYLKIYPVPTKDLLTIFRPQEIVVRQADILDLNGRVLKQYVSPRRQIDISALPTGLYFVRVRTDRGIVVKRVVKE